MFLFLGKGGACGIHVGGRSNEMKDNEGMFFIAMHEKDFWCIVQDHLKLSQIFIKNQSYDTDSKETGDVARRSDPL